MMKLEVSKRAQNQWLRILVYYKEMGGQRAAASLLKHPESGFPEPLLADRKIRYRASIINDYYKVIYYVSGDAHRIAAFWDMRMSPEKLKKTI